MIKKIIAAAFTAAIFLFFAYKFYETFSSPKTQETEYIRKVSGSFSGLFLNEMEKAGLSKPQSLCAVESLKKKLPFSSLNPKDSYSVFFSSSGVFKYLEIYKNGKVYSSFYYQGKCVSKIFSESFEIFNNKVSGEISENLWNSMSAKKIPASVILDYTDIFSWKIDFLTEVREKDKFSVFYEEKRSKSGKILGYKISAAYYEGLETGRNIAVEFSGSYYDEKGKGARSFFLRAPLNYRRISSYFTYKRYHPVLKYVRPHLGIDYAAPSGTPISAVADGRISFAGTKGGYGKFVEISHAYGYVSTYGHLLKFSPKSKKGNKVSQGDIIGYVGATGIATGPHLDFRIKQNGQFLNYLKIKNRSSSDIPAVYKSKFLEKVSYYFPEI
ncbi:MAG: M23 family metallopeptidase [Elusimicrobia bacterium]|nr:M23 family metallopeptidase [Elusimicrobiota bacterium]